jgi:hypothetical protein
VRDYLSVHLLVTSLSAFLASLAKLQFLVDPTFHHFQGVDAIRGLLDANIAGILGVDHESIVTLLEKAEMVDPGVVVRSSVIRFDAQTYSRRRFRTGT